MQFLIYIIIGLILLVLAAYVFGALIVTLPAFGTGLGTVFLVQWVSRKSYAHNWQTSRSFVALTILLSVLAGAIATSGVLLLFYEQEWGFESSGEFVFACIVAAIAFIYGTVKISQRSRKSLQFSISAHGETESRPGSTVAQMFDQTNEPIDDTNEEPASQIAQRAAARQEEIMSKSVIGAVAKVLCPYCLDRDSIRKTDENKQQYFTCAHCDMRIPLEYMNNSRIPRDVVSAVGFRGHGKTVYFASLFQTMNNLASFWPGFYTFAIDEKSLDIVRQNSKLLKAGELPPATPMNFPTPTIVRFSNIPSLGDRFFLFYDTSGEAYARQSALIQHASFVRRSRTVIFILSLNDLEQEDQKMHELLSVYVQGLSELKGNPRNQHLIIVLSKGDRLKGRLEKHEDIWRYLEEGRLDKLGNERLSSYTNGMKKISLTLRNFVRDDMGEAEFLNFAADRFKSVEFSIVSALGAEPAGNRLQVGILPKRIIDPLLWVIYKSLGLFQRGSM